MSNDIILKVENLETRYEKEPAVQYINFEVKTGQIVTLLGSNGVGKSTVLKTISGIVPSSAGKTIFFGEDITNMPAHEIVKRGLIHVPEGRKIFKD